MKQFVKMSLAAAVAVAGLSTTSSAASLEEAIKGVDVSGSIRYRYDEASTDNTDTHLNDYDAEMNIKVPVNDTVTANLKIDVSGELDQSTVGDAKPNINLEDVYFTYAPGYMTVMAGKQNIPGPFTDGGQGTGVVALVPAGAVTIAGGYFNMHSIDRDDSAAVSGAYPDLDQTNAAAVALLGALGPVNFEAWYADVDDVLDTFSISASATVGPVAVAVRHSETEYDDFSSAEVELTQVSVSGAAGPVNLFAAYATTGDDNGLDADTDGDADLTLAIDASGSDSANGFGLWQADASDLPDSKTWAIGASMEVIPAVTLGLSYADGETDDGTGDVDYDEILFDAAYQMSPNFKVSTKLSQMDVDGTETDKGRLEILYTF